MQQKVLSAVQLPTLGGKRRVHNDGIMMLDNHYNLREMEQKHMIMENRLKRLEDEEKRAQKNQLAGRVSGGANAKTPTFIAHGSQDAFCVSVAGE